MVSIAQAYYQAMAEKNGLVLETYLHQDVQFVSPLREMTGKETVIDAVRSLMNAFQSLTIRLSCSTGNQAVVVYDIQFPEPIGKSSAAALLTINNGLITNIELIFDARPFASSR